MTAAKSGDSVKVHYTGSLDDGTIFDSSRDREPLEFTIGSNMVIPGFENAVTDMEPGATKTITIASADAYGPRNPELVHQLERSQIPEGVELTPGAPLQAEGPNGETVLLTVVEVSETNVTLDANHPLAGRDLTFEIELVSIG